MIPMLVNTKTVKKHDELLYFQKKTIADRGTKRSVNKALR